MRAIIIALALLLATATTAQGQSSETRKGSYAYLQESCGALHESYKMMRDDYEALQYRSEELQEEHWNLKRWYRRAMAQCLAIYHQLQDAEQQITGD